MQKITFVLPSRNNLEFLKLAYKSIRNLGTKHEVLILDDASIDGTLHWIESLKDDDLIVYSNPGPERIGIVGMFDKGIEMAKTEIIFAFHADMVAAPNLDVNILKHLTEGTVVSATRVEPPLHPPGPEKITLPWGNEVEDYNYDKCVQYFLELESIHKNKTTEGIFAPWCMYKKDYLSIGGHDEVFAPQSKEDSDLFNRFVLNGYNVIQSWDGLVYHFTSRGSRFNKHAGGGAGKNSDEWTYTTTKNSKEFIRKWGHFVKHDTHMKPIIPPKYNVGFILNNASMASLSALETWCTTVYIHDKDNLISSYIAREQTNTLYSLADRVLPFDSEKNNDILVEFDANIFNQEDFNIVQQLSEIIKDSGEIGTFQINNLKITINSLKEYQNDLIHLK